MFGRKKKRAISEEDKLQIMYEQAVHGILNSYTPFSKAAHNRATALNIAKDQLPFRENVNIEVQVLVLAFVNGYLSSIWTTGEIPLSFRYGVGVTVFENIFSGNHEVEHERLLSTTKIVADLFEKEKINKSTGKMLSDSDSVLNMAQMIGLKCGLNAGEGNYPTEANLEEYAQYICDLSQDNK